MLNALKDYAQGIVQMSPYASLYKKHCVKMPTKTMRLSVGMHYYLNFVGEHPMLSVRYIHAALLHLDAAFSGLSGQKNLGQGHDGPLEKVLSVATFTALDRLVALCQREKPDFLVLAGDTYFAKEGSIQAPLALHRACVRLAKSGIEVFIVHGQHNPLSLAWQSLSWPENTTIFGAEMGHKVVVHKETQQPLAVVHGISYAGFPRDAAMGNRGSTSWRRLEDSYGALFQLGLVAHARRQDLEESNLDAFALGHGAAEQVLCQKPYVACSGTTQGICLTQQGSKGCVLVQVTAHSQEDMPENGQDAPFTFQSSFHPLGPVLWEQCDIALDSLENMHQVEMRIHEAVADVAAYAPLHCQAIILRLRLTGQTVLDGILRSTDFCAAFTARWQQEQEARFEEYAPSYATHGHADVGYGGHGHSRHGYSALPLSQKKSQAHAEKGLENAQTHTDKAHDTQPASEQRQNTAQEPLCFLWLKDIMVHTTPSPPLEQLYTRDDLLGETLRLAHALEQAGQELTVEQADDASACPATHFVHTALQPLYTHAKAQALLPFPSPEQSRHLLKEAQQLCAEIMESR